jgi:hypothetical protein
VDAFAHGGRCSLRRIRAEIEASLRRTGEPPGEIVLTTQEMADLKNDPEILLVSQPSVGTIIQIAGVSIREAMI